MKDIFYFTDESLLCWVAGYTADSNTSDVGKMIESLSENAEKFAAAAQIPVSKVQTYFVEKSRRYKYMRVFYAKVAVAAANIPPDTYKIEGNGWTMHKWLSD